MPTRRRAAAAPAPPSTPAATQPSSAPPATTQPSSAPPATTQPSAGGEGALVLTGPPGRVRAAVTVENRGDRRLAVRGAVLRRPGAPDVAAPAVARVAAGDTASVPVTLRLEPGTPPGDYGAELEVAGRVRAVVLRVEQDVDLRLSPRRLVVGAGDTVVDLEVRNAGNVDVPLAATTRGRLHDGTRDDRSAEVGSAEVRSAEVRSADKPGTADGSQRYDVRLVLDRAPTVRAGTVERLRGTLTVPSSLDPTRRHEAALPVGTADLVVLVLPHDPAVRTAPAPGRTARPKPARARKRATPQEEP